MERLWVFDGDDTLWYVEPLYDAARARAAELVAAAGLDPVSWERRERELDVANVEIYGVSRERFPTSCVQAYIEVAHSSGCPPEPLLAEEVRRAAATVFTAQATVHPDARRVIETLRAVGRTVLLTKGDEVVQAQRVHDSGLADCFDQVRIVPEKDEGTFLAVLKDNAFRPDAAWSIGNSLRSDINPALRVGMNAVWVDAHVWEYERTELMPSHAHARIVNDLREVPLETTGIPLELA